MTASETTDWQRQAETFARNDLAKVRSALKARQVHLGLLFNDMRGALNWAVEHWLRRNGEVPGPSWHDQEARFLGIAPPDIRDEYLRVAGSITGLANDLIGQVAPGVEDIAIAAPSLAPWRDKAGQWIAVAESLIARLTDPDAALSIPRGAKRIGRGALRGDLDGLMPCLVLARIGGNVQRWAEGGDTPGLFDFGEGGYESPGALIHKGLLLPLAFCRDPDLKFKLHACSDQIRARRTAGRRDAAGHRQELQVWLDREGLDFLRLADKAPVGAWTRFALDREVFSRLLQTFDYVTALLDGPGQPTRVLERAPFCWTSQGGLLDWCMGGEEPEHPLVPFHLYLAAEVEGMGPSLLESGDRKWLVRPDAYWEPFTRPAPDTDAAGVVIRLNQEEMDYGWVDLEIGLGDQTAVVTLSDVYDPFPSLLDWLLAVAEDDLPLAIDIDEEGSEACLVAHAFEEDRLLVAVLDRWQETSRAAAVVSRNDVLDAFRAELARFLRHGLRPDRWRGLEDDDDKGAPYVERLLAHPFLTTDP
ncbi:MAG: hypothetical protein HQL36_03950 [Alphaproteobacteria bacterium]|nr:hypothetical protein [Alphaproteobacteria bacterium]